MDTNEERLEKIINNPSSNTRLECTESYKGIYDHGLGGIEPYSYEKGEILKRRQIFLIKGYWKIAE